MKKVKYILRIVACTQNHNRMMEMYKFSKYLGIKSLLLFDNRHTQEYIFTKSRTSTKRKEGHRLQNNPQSCTSFQLQLELEFVPDFPTYQVHILAILS